MHASLLPFLYAYANQHFHAGAAFLSACMKYELGWEHTVLCTYLLYPTPTDAWGVLPQWGAPW
jgi:hypothetical protein